MQTLIVTAHPASQSFTKKITEAYQKAKQDSGNSVEILDLYKTDLRQDFLQFENPHDLSADPARDAIQTKITAADELILIFPIWWGDAPAILKNFLDQNFTTDFAFRYEKGKPVGLLKGKTARIFATCDGPGFFYAFFPVRLSWLWHFARLGFCGVRLQSFDILGSKRAKSAADLEKFLSKVAKRAR